MINLNLVSAQWCGTQPEANADSEPVQGCSTIPERSEFPHQRDRKAVQEKERFLEQGI